MPIVNGTRAGLPAPLIYDVEYNGGLGVREVGEGVNTPVTVIVGPWDLFQNGDRVRILWGGRDGTVVATRDMAASDALKPIPVPVAPSAIRALGDGVFVVYVEVIAVIGEPLLSQPLSVRVKTTRPGGFDKQPDTETINENLAMAQVHPDPLGEDISNVRVVVARYENIAEGDRLRVSWHGQFVDVPPLTASDIVKDLLEVAIPEALIRTAGGGDVRITYRVLDAVSNNSLWAPYRVTDVPIDDPDAPMAPWVEGTVDDAGAVLRLADLDNGPVNVVAEKHGGKKGARIQVRWAGVAAGEQAVPVYQTEWKEITRDDGSMRFTVPFEQALILGEGRVVVSYRLEHANGIFVTSRRRNLTIEGKAIGLALPQVQDTPGGVLDAATHKQGALLIAPNQPERIPAGSHVTFKWVGTAQGSAEAYADGVSDTFAVLPYDQILALVGGTVRIQYIVETFSTDMVVLAIIESGFISLDVIDSAAEPALAPPYVPQAADDILDPNALLAHLAIPPLAHGTHVKATIQARVPFEQALPIGDPAHPPMFTLSASGFIKPNNGSVASASYVVTAPGYSATSTSYAFRIGEAQAHLPPPTVREAVADHLDPIVVAEAGGVTVVVPASLEPGDEIIVNFGSWHSAPVAWPGGMTVVVPTGEVALRLGTTVEVTYTVNASETSPAVVLSIGEFGNEDERLPSPVIREADGKTLDLNTFDGDATIAVLPWPLIAQGQKVWLSVEGTKENGTVDRLVLWTASGVTAGEVERGLQKAIGRAWLSSLKDASTATVTLRVTFDHSADDGHAVGFPRPAWQVIGMNEPLDIGEDHVMELNFYVFHEPPEELVTPGQTKYTRTAKGGTPPYRYESSDRNVGIVNPTRGIVQLTGNGTTVIRVIDAKGKTATYALSVSGLTTIWITGLVLNWQAAREHARQKGMYLLDLDIAKVIWRLYAPFNSAGLGNALRIGNEFAWTTHAHGSGNYWAYQFNGTDVNGNGQLRHPASELLTLLT